MRAATATATAPVEESHAFRAALEPAAILSPTFRPDPMSLANCRRQQQHIAGEGYRTMTPAELFETNAWFHETLVRWSGNRFMLQALQRLNRLRRLIEYRQAVTDREACRRHAEQHLAILDCVSRGDFFGAATLLHDHPESARREKAASAILPLRRNGEAVLLP